MKIELLEKMIELCEQRDSYENSINSYQWSIDFGMVGEFPQLVRKFKHRINLHKVYIEFLNDKLNRLKLEL